MIYNIIIDVKKKSLIFLLYSKKKNKVIFKEIDFH